MKKIILILASALLAGSTFAAKTKLTPAQAEAKYTAAIEGRTDAILKILNLSDTNKIARVHDAIIGQYRAINAWDNANDAKIKAAHHDKAAIAKIQVSLRTLHTNFLATLAENLTPEQIEKVKDKMTYGKVQFTFQGYLNEYPNMSKANQAQVLKFLKEAREKAMDGGSANEKSAIFNDYKGKINNYLSKEGVHSKKWLAEHSETNSPTK